MKHLITIRALMLLAAFTFATTLSACGGKPAGTDNTGGNSSGTGAGQDEPSGPTPGVTDSEIRIGQPAAFSGPSAGLGVEMWRGAIAAFREANDAGGVHGRTITLVLADDGYEASRAAGAVQHLVEKEQVFCIGFGVGTPTIVRQLPLLKTFHEKDRLFMFSNFTGAQPQRNEPYAHAVFNIRASYRQETAAMVNAFIAAGRKTIGVFIQADAYGNDGRDGARLALEAHGLDLAVTTQYTRGQTWKESYADQVKQLKDAGCDAIIAVGAYQACGGLVRDCRAIDWDVPIHNVSFVGADQMLELLKTEQQSTGKKLIHNLLNTQVVPHYDDTSLALIGEYRAAIDKYQPEVPGAFADATQYRPKSAYSFGSLEGYVSARALLHALRATGKNLTRTGFIRATEGLGEFDLGLGVPCHFSADRHQMLDKVWFTYADADGWLPTADPGSVLTEH